MRDVLTITHLTLHEAMRRRILIAALICGAAFLTLYAVGLGFVVREELGKESMTLIERRVILNIFTLAGLYAANMLIIMTAVLLPVDTLSGEIGSGVIQTLAAKPIRRRASAGVSTMSPPSAGPSIRWKVGFDGRSPESDAETSASSVSFSLVIWTMTNCM